VFEGGVVDSYQKPDKVKKSNFFEENLDKSFEAK
jgi:hypothetical protein